MSTIDARTKANEYYACFTMVGEFEPNDITTRLGIKPTDCWKKGDRNERTHIERKFSRWSLYTRLDRSEVLEAHVDDVLEQLQPIREKIVDLRNEVDGGMQLVAFFHRGYPGLHFEVPTLSKLAAMNLSMDMDFYYLYSDKREDSE